MKKKQHFTDLQGSGMKKLLLVMKLTTFFLFLSVMAMAANTYSQETRFDLKVENASIIQVFDEIERVSEFGFLFKTDQLDLNRKYTLDLKKTSIEKLLKEILNMEEYAYRFIDRNIVITRMDSYTQQDNNSKKVSGKVTDSSGESLPGVSVVVKGTTLGTITDANGNYSFSNVPDNATLQFSFVGMKMQEVVVGNQTFLDVALKSDFLQIDEVVVTALGIEREKKALGYSVGQVTNEEITGSNETNIVSALSGKVAGVAISTSSGQAGGAARITIRGNSSINYNNQPLFIIDGVPFDNSENTIKNTSYQGGGTNTGIDIDPNNIESLNILKGASASALYGSKAANGVVVITTKGGGKDKVRVNYSFKTSMDNIIELPLSTTYAQGEYVNGVPTYFDGETKKTSLSWGPRIEDVPGAVRYDKWAAFVTGHRDENSFNISGGSDKVNYYASVTNLNQKGLLKPIEFQRTNMFFKMNADVTKWLGASLSFSYIRTDAERLSEGLSRELSFMTSLMDMPNSWNPFPIFNENGVERVWTNSAYNNPYWMLDNTLNTSFRNRFLPIFGLNFKITKDLTLNTKVGLDAYTSNEDDYANSGGKGGTSTGVYNIMTSQYFNFNSDIMLNYKRQIMDDLSFDFMVGHNIQANRNDYSRINGKDFIIPDFKSINNAQTKVSSSDYSQRRSVSAYGQAVLSYKSLLYYTFSGRNDWSSTLPKDDNSYFYSSNSLAFVFSELFENDIVSFGKLRAAYSQVGNDAPPYSIYTTYETGGGGGLTFPYNGVGTFSQSWRANNIALKNEMTRELELGLEMSLFRDRLGLEASVYDKTSFDQIVSADISNSTGYGAAMINVGEMENKGVELLVYGSPIKTKDFNWEISLNWSANRNKVIKITDAVDKIGGGSWGLSIWEGYSYPVVELDYFITDDNGNYIVDDNPQSSYYGYQINANKYKGVTRPAGKVEPDWRGGIRNTLTYKGFKLSAFVDMMFGGYTHNMNEQYTLNNGTSPLTENRSADDKIVWPGVKGHVDQTTGALVISGEPNDIPVSFTKAFLNQGYKFNAAYKMQKSDYVKLREVSFSYDFPDAFISKTGFIKDASVSVSGNNLWRWFDKSFTGADPEYNLQGSGNAQGMSIYMMPSYKSFNFGFNLTF